MGFEIDHSIRIKVLGNQVTVYDLEGNVIEMIPPPPKNPPTIKYFNIVEFEDRLMGIDPNARPDYFINFETDERFFDVNKDPKFNQPEKKLDFTTVMALAYMLAICCVLIVFGFIFY